MFNNSVYKKKPFDILKSMTRTQNVHIFSLMILEMFIELQNTHTHTKFKVEKDNVLNKCVNKKNVDSFIEMRE